MGGHDAVDARKDRRFEGHELERLQAFERVRHDRQITMRVDIGIAVAREVLANCADAA